MTARFSRAAQQSIEFPRKARGHRPRLQLTEYRLNRNSSTSGVLTFLGRSAAQKPDSHFDAKRFLATKRLYLPTTVEVSDK